LPGGWCDVLESIKSNTIKEVKEETGLILTEYKLRCMVTFVSDKWETEHMYVYTATNFEGELHECDEGILKWIDKEKILDFMGSEELAANLFRITQTESRLKRDKVDTEKKACDTHNKIGKIVRKAIKQAGRNYARRIAYT